MTGLALAFLLLAAPVALVNWVGVARTDRRLVYVAKPLTLVLLIAAAVALDPTDAGVRAWFVAGLVLSLAGDVFLMLPEDRELPLPVPPFLLGLVAFLLGHVAYVAGKLSDLDIGPLLLVSAVLVAIGGGVVAPRVVAAVQKTQREMVVPVIAYMSVISAMVLSAGARGVVVGLVGAALFFTSDAILAWNRFIAPSRTLQIAVMVTYHLAQLGLVLSLLG